MWPDRVSNPGPLTYESGALHVSTAPRGPVVSRSKSCCCCCCCCRCSSSSRNSSSNGKITSNSKISCRGSSSYCLRVASESSYNFVLFTYAMS